MRTILIKGLTSAARLREENNLRHHVSDSDAFLVVSYVECLLIMSYHDIAPAYISEDKALPPAWLRIRVAREGSTLIHSAE